MVIGGTGETGERSQARSGRTLPRVPRSLDFVLSDMWSHQEFEQGSLVIRFCLRKSLLLDGGGCIWEAGRAISRESIDITGETWQWPSPKVVEWQ